MKRSERRKPNEQEKAAAERVKRYWLAKKKELGLNQDVAAEALGWSQSGFNAYLNARNPLNVSAVLKLSKLLSVPPYELAPEIVGDNPITPDEIVTSEEAELSPVAVRHIRSITRNVSRLSDHQLKDVDFIIDKMVSLMVQDYDQHAGRATVLPEAANSTEPLGDEPLPLYKTLPENECIEQLAQFFIGPQVMAEDINTRSPVKRDGNVVTTTIDGDDAQAVGAEYNRLRADAIEQGLLPRGGIDVELGLRLFTKAWARAGVIREELGFGFEGE